MDDREKKELWWRVAEKHFEKPPPPPHHTVTEESASAFSKLRDFLGVSRTRHFLEFWTPELEQKLLMLDGPHGKTLFKAMEAVKCQMTSSRSETAHELKSL